MPCSAGAERAANESLDLKPCRRARAVFGPAALLLFFLALPAAAQEERPALTSNDFNIDLVNGPVLGTGRVIGLGGAYTALVTGVDGASWNAASYAARGYWELDWFEWEGSANLIPGTIRNSDFDNNGESGFTYDDFLFASLGARFQFGAFGLGGMLNVQTYNIGAGSELTLIVGNYGVGYDALGGQLVIGLGARTANLAINDRFTTDELVAMGGTGPEAGVLVRPAKLPFRIGLAARSAVSSSESDALVAAGLDLPRRLEMPWELQAGIAWQLGPRPFNKIWENPHDVEERLRERMLDARRERARRQAEEEARQRRMALSQQTAPPRLPHMGGGEPLAGDGVPRDPEWLARERERRWAEERELLAQLAEWEELRQSALRGASRRYLVLAADVIVVGAMADGVGLESFLAQRRHVSGRQATVGLHFGAEGEPIERWVKMRAGTYLEPSRFEGVGYRAHATVGFDIRLFSWDLFGLLDEFTLRLGSFADVAERYLNAGIGLGLWH